MRINPLDTRSVSGGKAAADKSGPAVSRPAEPAARLDAPAGKGVRGWDPRFNEQMSSAQRTLNYLDTMGAMLESIKKGVTGKLAARQSGDAGLYDKLRQFASLWREREELTGGSLDGRLEYSGAGQARQRFSIRGLDMGALQSGAREKLDFSVAAGQGVMTVLLEPGMTQEAAVLRFNQALAPSGIRVDRDERGTLSFSVPESAWAQVRDTLSVKGGGIRFPDGQMHRAKVDMAPDAVRPETWGGEDVQALRRTLQEVLDALDRVREMKEVVRVALANIRARVESAVASGEQEWAAAFAENFEAMARRPNYQIFVAVSPALASISRARVLSLLSLR